jgi:AcrR family transcriptional regulator
LEPTPRRSAAESQREISESAVRFLSEHRFRDLTVEKLMADTGLSRSAFYQYFEDLHHLMETLLASFDRALTETTHTWISDEGERVGALRESQRSMLQVGMVHGPVLRAIAEAAPHDQRLEQAFSSFLAEWDDAVADRIEADQRAGLVPPIDARSLAHALNRLDVAVLIDSFGHRPQADPEAVLDTLHRIWSSALYGG